MYVGGWGGGVSQCACKNMVEYKSEQVLVVGGRVYSGRGVKETVDHTVSLWRSEEHKTRVFSGIIRISSSVTSESVLLTLMRDNCFTLHYITFYLSGRATGTFSR